MTPIADFASLASRTDSGARDREQRLEPLIQRLPRRVQRTVRWLRRPSSRWVRLPAGVLLIVGGLLSILPLFGLWMLPLGVMLLAEDVPPLRRATNWLLDRIEQRWPDCFAVSDDQANSASAFTTPRANQASASRPHRQE